MGTSRRSNGQSAATAQANGVTGTTPSLKTCSTQDKEKPVLFSMARLDTVKNLTGLAEWYGRNERLRKVQPGL